MPPTTCLCSPAASSTTSPSCMFSAWMSSDCSFSLRNLVSRDFKLPSGLQITSMISWRKVKGMFSAVLPSLDLKHYMLRLWLSAIKNCSPTSLCLYHTLSLTLPKASEEFLSHLVKLGLCRLLQWPQVFICKIPLGKEQEKTQQRSAWKTWLGIKSID